nr:conserved hypothetical protein [Rhizobiaceae bacterium]
MPKRGQRLYLEATSLGEAGRPTKGMAGAEGATAPETLRQKDQQGAVGTLERSVFRALAEGITISGEGTEGAQESGAKAPGL